MTEAITLTLASAVALVVVVKFHEALALLFAAIADRRQRRQLDHDAPRVHDLKPREEW